MNVFEKLRKQELLRKICTLELNITLGEGHSLESQLVLRRMLGAC